MLKFKIDKKAYDALSDEMKAEYISGDSEGQFVLDISGLPEPEDTAPIKRALEREKETVKTLKREKGDLQAKVDEAPDVEAMTTKHAAEVKKYKDFTEKTLLDGTATAMATKISTVPTLMSKAIKERLVVDLEGDVPTVKIKGVDGQISADLTLEKLSQEFVANKEFSGIMIGSKASGGGAPNPTIKPLGGGAPKDGEQAVDLSKLSGADMAARITARKEAEAQAAQ